MKNKNVIVLQKLKIKKTMRVRGDIFITLSLERYIIYQCCEYQLIRFIHKRDTDVFVLFNQNEAPACACRLTILTIHIN